MQPPMEPTGDLPTCACGATVEQSGDEYCTECFLKMLAAI
jgi:hypothetical protein